MQIAKNLDEGSKCSVTRILIVHLFIFYSSVYLFIYFVVFNIYRRGVSKSFSETYKVPVCKTGMMSLLQSSPVQHSAAHSSWVNLCVLSPFKKPPTAAQAAFLSVIIGQNK